MRKYIIVLALLLSLVALPVVAEEMTLAKVSEEAGSIISEMIADQYDDYGTYYDEDDFAEFFSSVTGDSYVGIGVYMIENSADSTVSIVSVMKDRPAYNAGMQPGDIFLALNGEDVAGWSADAISSYIKSSEEGLMEILIYREGEGELLVEVMVESVTVPSVEGEMLDLDSGIGYILISAFYSETDDDFENLLNDLIDEGMTSLILDLRNNGGGDVNAALNIADIFLEYGDIIIQIEDKYSLSQYVATSRYYDIPVVILQNGATASASEIVIGALIDNKVAMSVGTTTYGKGIMQQIWELTDGTGVRITYAQYLTPNGNEVQGIGIEPSVEFESYSWFFSDDLLDDDVILKAMEYL